jgi:hypothetical protein
MTIRCIGEIKPGLLSRNVGGYTWSLEGLWKH